MMRAAIALVCLAVVLGEPAQELKERHYGRPVFGYRRPAQQHQFGFGGFGGRRPLGGLIGGAAHLAGGLLGGAGQLAGGILGGLFGGHHVQIGGGMHGLMRATWLGAGFRFPRNLMMPRGFWLPKGFFLPRGFRLPAGFRVSGFNFPSGSFDLGADLRLPGRCQLPAHFQFPANFQLSVGFSLPKGFKLPFGWKWPAGFSGVRPAVQAPVKPIPAPAPAPTPAPAPAPTPAPTTKYFESNGEQTFYLTTDLTLPKGYVSGNDLKFPKGFEFPAGLCMPQSYWDDLDAKNEKYPANEWNDDCNGWALSETTKNPIDVTMASGWKLTEDVELHAGYDLPKDFKAPGGYTQN